MIRNYRTIDADLKRLLVKKYSAGDDIDKIALSHGVYPEQVRDAVYEAGPGLQKLRKLQKERTA